MSQVPCPHCGTLARAGKKFCGSCGGAISNPGGSSKVAPQTGKSSIELDADSINILLSEFVNQPDSYQVEYRDGKLHVDQGSFQIVVDQLPLANTTLEIHYQQVGTVGVKVEQFDLTPNSVKANLELGIKR